MNLPIYDFLKDNINLKKSRFYMPGHKGESLSTPLDFVLPYDITEIKGADALFCADSIIGMSEQNASEIFSSKYTLYSTQGSTLCIFTMLKLISKPHDKIIAVRNAHSAFVNGCFILDLDPIWILPENTDTFGIYGQVSPKQIEKALKENPDACAVYITSPDYLGNTVDIKAVAKICDSYCVPLICDNAHGSYLKFCEPSAHPIDLGVTMCCDSAHKTLPVLTSGAYLHISDKCSVSKKEAKYAMSLFASTSPSYLTLMSLDLCNKYLSEKAKEDFLKLRQYSDKIKDLLKKRGISFLNNETDFAKITIDVFSTGYKGEELYRYFARNKIECEFYNDEYMVFLISPFNSKKDFERFYNALEKLPLKAKGNKTAIEYKLPEKCLTPKEAMTKDSEYINIDEAVGRICAQTVFCCPPGVPIAVGGEKITEQVKKNYKYYGNKTIKVLK